MRIVIWAAAPALLSLVACGQTVERQAASGGLGGAVAGATVGGPVGAVVGGAAGAGIGAATAEDRPARQTPQPRR